jgi:hypothetical protein
LIRSVIRPSRSASKCPSATQRRTVFVETAGDPLVEVESMWNKAHGTSQRVSLAVYGQIRSLDGWLRTESRRKGLGVATSAVHDNLRSGTDPKDAIYHARRMIDDIRGGAR